jgi:general secretion pathway protein H
MSGRHRGFTLIELLVSITIIGIVLSIAVLSLNLASDDREIRTEAQRLMSILTAVQDDAVLQGRDFGIEFLSASYRFVEYDNQTGQWYDVAGDDLMRVRNLPEEYELTLFLEDKQILLDESPLELADAEDDEPDADVLNYAPHILIFSSGDMTPFELHFTRLTDRLSVPIEGDLLGNLDFVTDDDDQY